MFDAPRSSKFTNTFKTDMAEAVRLMTYDESYLIGEVNSNAEQIQTALVLGTQPCRATRSHFRQYAMAIMLKRRLATAKTKFKRFQ